MSVRSAQLVRAATLLTVLMQWTPSASLRAHQTVIGMWDSAGTVEWTNSASASHLGALPLHML